MAWRRERRAAAVVAEGERSVAIGGDVANSVIVTGSNVTLDVHLEGDDVLLERLRAGARPSVRPRRPHRRVGELPDLVDRVGELESVLAALASARGVNLYGESGVGKTYVLLRTARDFASAHYRDGVRYLLAKGRPFDDLLQDLFEEFYECDPPSKPSRPELRRYLEDREAVIFLDSVDAERDEMEAIFTTAAAAQFVVASTERRLWQGKGILLRGLADDDALTLVEVELGRPLPDDERPAVKAICRALGGHPLRIREAVALARDQGLSFDAVARRLTEQEPVHALAAAQLASLSEDDRKLVTALALADGVTVGEPLLAHLTGMAHIGRVLDGLESRRVVVSNSPRYRLSAALAKFVPAEWLTRDAAERALSGAASWTEENRSDPDTLAEESTALARLLGSASALGAFREVIEVGRALAGALAVSRRWGSWAEVVGIVLDAGRRTGDRAAQAWGLHQQGTLVFGLTEDGVEAAPALESALRIRESLGDERGARATSHNLRIVRAEPPWFGRLPRVPFTLLSIVLLALVVGSAVGGVALWRANDDDVGGGGSVTPVEASAVSVRIEGDGDGTVESSPDGIACGDTCTATFAVDDVVTLSATASEGSVFVGWGGTCSGKGDCEVSAGEGVVVTARFDRRAGTATLNVVQPDAATGLIESTPAGIDCGETCSAEFPVEAEVTLTAVPAEGFELVAWGGACSGTAECKVKMDRDRRVTVTFEPTTTTHAVTVEMLGDGGGLVTSEPPGIDCGDVCEADFPADRPITLSAEANADSVFVGWGGDCTGTRRCRLSLEEATTVTATFGPGATLTVDVTGEGGSVRDASKAISCGTVCRAAYERGAEVTLTATATEGFVFYGWSVEDCDDAELSCSFTLEADTTVTARFGPPIP